VKAFHRFQLYAARHPAVPFPPIERTSLLIPLSKLNESMLVPTRPGFF
jgi:hypothetical protein